MAVQIICNVIMFLAYAVNIGYFVYKLVDIDRGLKTLWSDIEKLICKELFSKIYDSRFTDSRYIYSLQAKKFDNKFGFLCLWCLGTLIIIFATCLLDGLSYKEPFNSFLLWGILLGTLISVIAILTVFISLEVKKYHLIKLYRPPMSAWRYAQYWWQNIPIAYVTSLIFATSTFLVALTICFLCM